MTFYGVMVFHLTLLKNQAKHPPEFFICSRGHIKQKKYSILGKKIYDIFGQNQGQIKKSTVLYL